MPRSPKHPPIVCEYFTWKLFCRDNVFYADGRGTQQNLGKHSLATKNREEALKRLKALDRRMAVKLGIAQPETAKPSQAATIQQGWQAFIDFCGQSPVMGGVSPGTLKRYRAVRDKHAKFCAKHGITDWSRFDKSVNQWLIENAKLSAEARITYSLSKPAGTDTYCYSRSEVGAMIKHCESTSGLQWLAYVIIALAHLGVRIGELAGLRWTDVDVDNNVVTVADERASRRKRLAGTMRTTKGKRSRKIPIHPRLREVLATIAHDTDGRVFHAERGGQLRPRNLLMVFIRDVIEPLAQKFPTPEGEIGFEHYRHLGRMDAVRRMEQISFVDLDADDDDRGKLELQPADNGRFKDGHRRPKRSGLSQCLSQ